MKNTVILTLVLASVLYGAGCLTNNKTTPANGSKAANTVLKNTVSTSSSQTGTESGAAQISGAVNTYTLDDLAKHATQSDCWMAVNGQVYNITLAIAEHPGGRGSIMKGCGKDGTALFNQIEGGRGHSGRAEADLSNYLMGTLK